MFTLLMVNAVVGTNSVVMYVRSSTVHSSHPEQLINHMIIKYNPLYATYCQKLCHVQMHVRYVQQQVCVSCIAGSYSQPCFDQFQCLTEQRVTW